MLLEAIDDDDDDDDDDEDDEDGVEWVRGSSPPLRLGMATNARSKSNTSIYLFRFLFFPY